MVSRQRTIILIIKLLYMNILLKLKKVNLKYKTGKDNINVLNNINLITKKKEPVSIVKEDSQESFDSDEDIIEHPKEYNDCLSSIHTENVSPEQSTYHIHNSQYPIWI